MFVGRESELEGLSALWRKRTSSLVACRGRRRIGKSRLIREFAKRTADCYIELVGLSPRPNMTNADQLEAFAAGLARASKGKKRPLASWDEAFAALDELIDDRKKTVIMLDEVSWMGGYDPDFPGYLKTAWDTMFHLHDRLVIVVCGSVNTWIKKNILDSTGFVGRFSRDYVLGELPLCDCVRFWGRAAARLNATEIVDVLSVTGGIPRYLEEIDPGLTAEENIRRLCFLPQGLLFKDFNEIFSSVFGCEAVLKRQIVAALVDGPLTGQEIAASVRAEYNGHFGAHLRELELAGFISAESGLSPLTGKRTRIGRYRIRDNYSRIYLKYIEPHAEEIAAGTYAVADMARLPGWTSVMGLQFENLVVNHVAELLPFFHLGGAIVVSAAPFRHRRDSRGGGCQVDLLVQTARTAYVVEVKRQGRIGREVEDQVEREMKCLCVRKGLSVRPVLVYLGELDPEVEGGGFFDVVLPASRLMGLGEAE